MKANFKSNATRLLASLPVPCHTAIQTTPRLSGLPLSGIKEKYLDAPLLLASVDPSNWDDSRLEPNDFSWSAAFARDGTPILMFRQQFGTNLLRILADPADPQTWTMLDMSDKTGSLSIAALHAGEGSISSGPFRLTDAANTLRGFAREPEQRKKRFQRLATHMVLSKDIQDTARSLSPDMPTVVHAQDCVLVYALPSVSDPLTQAPIRTRGHARPAVH